MSTRSGKRIHGSIHENVLDNNTEAKSARKTRGKRQKENCEEVLITEKKRKNYVRYPSEEDIADAIAEKTLRSSRKSQRNALKEQNILATDSETSNDDARAARHTRRARKIESAENVEPSDDHKQNKPKNNRKSKAVLTNENTLSEPTTQTIIKKKSNKKKNKKKSNSLTVEDMPETIVNSNNISNVSNDSFHSAAGSFVLINNKELEEDNEQDPNLLIKLNKNESCMTLDDIKLKRSNSKRNKKSTAEQTSNTSTNLSKPIGEKVGISESKSDVNDGTIQQKCTNLLIVSPSSTELQNKSNKKKKSKQNVSTENTIINMSKSEIECEDHISSSDQLQTLDTTYTTSAKKKRKSSTLNEPNFTENPYNVVDQLEKSQDDSINVNGAMGSNKKKRKSSVRKSISGKFENIINLDATYEKEPTESNNCIENLDNLKNQYEDSQNNLITINNTRESNKMKQRSSNRMSINNLNATYENELIDHTNVQGKESRKSRQSFINNDLSTNLNRTYDKMLKTGNHTSSHNSTYDISSKVDTTFEINKNSKLDSTFDKLQNNPSRQTSSIISFDTTDNLMTSSKNNSRISITSDDSSASENIVIIESSIDESQMRDSSHTSTKTILKQFNTEETTNPKSNHQTAGDDADVIALQHEDIHTKIKERKASRISLKCDEIRTEMKREGTYTEITTPKTPSKVEGITSEPKASKTPLKQGGTYTEIKNSRTSPKNEVIETEMKGSKTPSKRQETYTQIETSPTLKYKGLKTEGRTSKTPLKRDSTPHSNDEITTEDPATPTKRNETFDATTHATTPLKREGTFTKEDTSPNSTINKTPLRRKSLPSPGRTPFPASKSASKEKSVLNVTRSIEKSTRRLSSADLVPRATKVMFCSPANNPVIVTQMKGKIIKSNLKGSNKSFIFDESVSESVRPPRKRSYTHSEAEEVRRKRKHLTEDQQQSVDRLSRSRTASASGKLQDLSTSSKKAVVTPSKSKSDAKVQRTKLPNFAALHQKRFAKMESLDECQERKAKRARQLLTPTGSTAVLERISPREMQPDTSSEIQTKKTDTPKSTQPTEKPQAAYTRFGFKLNLDVNPFSFPAKTPEDIPKQPLPLKRQGTLPSLKGATIVRKVSAKQTIMREKSFTGRRDGNRDEYRTVIKGVRTNRRFELQMKMRNVNN